MIDMTEARNLMERGFSDREIGERVGCSKQRINDLRKRWKLPQRVAVMDDQVKRGIQAGWTRKEVEWRLGLSSDQVWESCHRSGVQHQQRTELERRNRWIMELVAAGKNDKEIAERLGLCRAAVGQIRLDNGHRKWATAEAREQRNRLIMDLAAAGKTDAEIAKQVGVCNGAVAHVRLKNGHRKLLTLTSDELALRRQKVHEAYVGGVSMRDVARQLNLAVHTVHNDLRHSRAAR